LLVDFRLRTSSWRVVRSLYIKKGDFPAEKQSLLKGMVDYLHWMMKSSDNPFIVGKHWLWQRCFVM
jgi:hypothetical protein